MSNAHLRTRIRTLQADLADALTEHAAIVNRDPEWVRQVLPDYLRHVVTDPVWTAYERMSASRISHLRHDLDRLVKGHTR